MFEKYYNYLDIFNKVKINELFLYKLLNYKFKFVKKMNKIKLLRNRIYLISNRKLNEIKKYLNEHFKKKIIISNYALFALFILFIKKSNKNLKFYINYRKLN